MRGLGGITIGLPLLEEMLPTASAAMRADVPVRAFNLFFGLGIPAPLQQEGFGGVLEPLQPLAEKLLIMRGVDHTRADEKGANAHYDGAAAAFTAEPPDGEAKAGGGSIDQLIRRAAHPDGLPAGMVPTLIGGTFSVAVEFVDTCTATIPTEQWRQRFRNDRGICLSVSSGLWTSPVVTAT